MRYDILYKLGEGNRGEVYKAVLENGQEVAIKWAKNYSIEKEWEILNYLNGYIAPKPIYKGNRYFIMELIKGKTLKDLDSFDYYTALRLSLIKAYELDEKNIYHSQLGRYYHIFLTQNNDIRFIDFERATFSKNARNFLQIVGYYLYRDKNFDKKYLDDIVKLYKINRLKAVENIIKEFDESIYQKKN